jgi:D-inositol-3-phosphate glycosyltransferase
MKILVCGDGVVPTGFARVLHSIVKHLPRKDYDIYWLAVNYYGDPHPYPYKIFPATGRDRTDLYGFLRLQDFVNKGIDIIFILNDAWIISAYLDYIKHIFPADKMPKIITYIPVDAYDHDPTWYRDFDIVTKTVAYTKFGQEEIKLATNNSVEPLIIPHGIDSDDFYQLPQSKTELRKKWYPDTPSIYEDSFIILNGNRNQPRKKIEISLMAFALFSENKPENVKFYYHGGVKDTGIDIIKIATRYGFQKHNRLILSSMDNGVQKLSTQMLNEVYNICDVGINTSLGEGWGLVNVEHAVTGAAQIVPMHSACREIFADCGLLVRPIVPVVFEVANTTGFLGRAEDYAEAMELLYNDKNLRNDLAQKAKTKFTSPEYSWKNIAKTWDKLFKEVVG